MVSSSDEPLLPPEKAMLYERSALWYELMENEADMDVPDYDRGTPEAEYDVFTDRAWGNE